jgi:hypothetical protein
VKRKRTDSLYDRAIAHPATGCGSNNNGVGRKAACKKVTGENPRRQPALSNENITTTSGKRD